MSFSTICRKRHTKCDEVKPICGPCAKGQRPCVYGTTATAPAQQMDALQTPSSSSTGNAFMENRPGEHTRFSPIRNGNQESQWHEEPANEPAVQIASPQSSLGSAYGTEVAPLRWFGLLAGDVTNYYDNTQEISPLETLGNAALSQSYLQPNNIDASLAQYAEPALRPSALSPQAQVDERDYWRSQEPIALQGHEHAMLERFVNGVSLWIDLFDPSRYFSSFVPHLALYNEGLMKALLALGARHLSIKPDINATEDTIVDRTASVQY